MCEPIVQGVRNARCCHVNKAEPMYTKRETLTIAIVVPLVIVSFWMVAVVAFSIFPQGGYKFSEAVVVNNINAQ